MCDCGKKQKSCCKKKACPQDKDDKEVDEPTQCEGQGMCKSCNCSASTKIVPKKCTPDECPAIKGGVKEVSIIKDQKPDKKPKKELVVSTPTIVDNIRNYQIVDVGPKETDKKTEQTDKVVNKTQIDSEMPKK